MTDVIYEAFWPAPPTSAKKAAIGFWEKLNAIPGDGSLDERANQIVMLAHVDHELLCVSTCKIAPVSGIGETMYHYRTMTSPDARMQQVATQVLIRSFEHLQAYNRERDVPEAVGVYMEIENPRLMKIRREGIWKDSRFVFIGRTREGWHRRLRYFDFATLSET